MNIFRKDLVLVQVDALQDVEVLLLLIWRSEGWSDNELDAVGHIGLRFETEWFWEISKSVLHAELVGGVV